MADAEDIQPLVCDNGTGMVKVWIQQPCWFYLIRLMFLEEKKNCDRDSRHYSF
jgi:hypothetical protein